MKLPLKPLSSTVLLLRESNWPLCGNSPLLLATMVEFETRTSVPAEKVYMPVVQLVI